MDSQDLDYQEYVTSTFEAAYQNSLFPAQPDRISPSEYSEYNDTYCMTERDTSPSSPSFKLYVSESGTTSSITTATTSNTTAPLKTSSTLSSIPETSNENNYLHPDKCLPKHYKQSWTMTQNNIPPPPLTTSNTTAPLKTSSTLSSTTETSKENIYLHPDKCLPKHYKQSWTMTQKNIPPPPLNLIGSKSTIVPLKTKKITIAATSAGTIAQSKLIRPGSPTVPANIILQPSNTAKTTQNHCCCSEENKKINNKLDQLMYLVKDMSRRMIHQNSGRSRFVSDEIQRMFPIQNIQDLEEIESRCANSTFRDNMTDHLTNLVSLGKGLTTAFKKTLSDEMSLQLNFGGTQRKIPFKKFKRINGIMFDAWKSPVDSVESFQQKLKMEFRKAHNRVHNMKKV